jgi:ornithine carbamoyltransferase
VQLKADRHLGLKAPTAEALNGSHVALLFEKPSLRTRSTFEVAVKELGGDVLNLSTEFAGGRETAGGRGAQSRSAGCACSWSARLRQARRAAGRVRAALHVINALTDEAAPCQALPMRCACDSSGAIVAAGEWRSSAMATTVATSLAHVTSYARHHPARRVAGGLRPARRVSIEAQQVSLADARVVRFRNPREAVAGVDAVYTDVWASMGEESELPPASAVRPYQVDSRLMSARGRTRCSCTACRPSRRGSHRRGASSRRVGRLRSGGESPARTEGAPADAARQRRRQ